jgi:hypothetical protein
VLIEGTLTARDDVIGGGKASRAIAMAASTGSGFSGRH